MKRLSNRKRKTKETINSKAYIATDDQWLGRPVKSGEVFIPKNAYDRSYCALANAFGLIREADNLELLKYLAEKGKGEVD